MPQPSLLILFLVAMGGAAGATLRYLVAVWTVSRFGAGFPIGTLTVNVVGSALIGVFAALWVETADPAARERAALVIIGLLGGFTTFSSFALDVVGLWLRDRPLAAGGYVLASVALSIAAAGLGLVIGRLLRG